MLFRSRLIGIFAESLIEEVGSIITGRPDRDTMIHLLGAAGLAGMPSPYVADITIGANRELDYVWMRYEVGNKRRSLTWSMRDYLAARSDPTFRPNARSDDIKEIPTSDG